MPQPSTDILKSARMPMQQRMAQLTPTSFNAEERTIDAMVSTGASVRTYDWATGMQVNEVLVVDAANVRMGRINNGAPVLDVHQSYELDNVIGRVLRAWIKNGELWATIKLSGREDVKPILQDIQDGILVNVSVGYRVYRYLEDTKPEDQIKTYRAVDWEPFEISIVPIPAEAGAGFRSESTAENPCEIVNQPAADPATIKENVSMPDKTIESAVDNPAVKNETPIDSATEKADASAENPASESAENNAVDKEVQQRVSQISILVRAAGLPTEFGNKLIEKGITNMDKVRAAILDEKVRQSEQHKTSNQIRVLRDENDGVIQAAENALLHRHNPSKFKLDDHAREFRGMTLIEMGKNILSRRSISTSGMSKAEVAAVMLGFNARTGMMTTSDFPGIVANVANKTLRQAYQNAPQTFKVFTRQTTASDFKTISRIQLGDAPTLEKVNEKGEIKSGSMADSKETYALATYAKKVSITRQTIINDDLEAFTRVPAAFGMAAADLESDTVWGIITANAAMADGTALFHANHGNLSSTSDVINENSLGASRTRMRLQTGPQKRILNLVPSYLIVPAAKEVVAQKYTTQPMIVAAKAADFNPFAGKLQVVVEPRLDASSTTAWYLAADPAQIDTIEYCYLEGQEGVYLEHRNGYDVDGIELKARLDFAAKAIDWRGLDKNPGA